MWPLLPSLLVSQLSSLSAGTQSALHHVGFTIWYLSYVCTRASQQGDVTRHTCQIAALESLYSVQGLIPFNTSLRAYHSHHGG